MSKLEFTIAENISLKNSEFNEDWLQARIAENPKILGLGELDLIERERKHKSGRLDILLADTQNDKRYEVEIMLGQLDESHIIRCIEYWDIEKKRYPHYEHCAVIVAEDITSRFLNVLSLFNGQIPLIAIQFYILSGAGHVHCGDAALLRAARARLGDAAGLDDVSRRPEHPQ